MDRHRRNRRMTALVALSAAFAISAIAPSLASGQNVVDDLLKGLGLGGKAAPQPQLLPPDGETGYQPPLHGTNPHGQGTAITGDLLPNSELPYSGDPAGGEECPDPTACEEVVLGRSRGEKNNPYHGHVTILSLFGNEISGVDTDPGESEQFGPLIPLFTPICAFSAGALCLGVLEANSETTENSSENSFQFFGLSSHSQFGDAKVNLFESEGNIEEDQNCQRSDGSSSVASISAGQNNSRLVEDGDGGFQLKVLDSSAESTACNNAPPTQTNDSNVFKFSGHQFFSCEDETLFGGFPLAFICNADDTNGVGEEVQQADEPYGVREALNVFLLPFFLHEEDGVASQGIVNGDGPLALIKGTLAASESHAVAPPTPPTPTTPSTPAGAGAGGQAGQQGGGPEGQAGGPEDGPVATTAGPGTGDLAFTGTDVLILGLIGAGLVLAGLTATRLAVRHRRTTV
jgi:hypothetical protein